MDLQQIEQQIDSNESLLKRLKRVRDQRIAHHDAIGSGDRTLLYGDMQRLVEAVMSMYNSLRIGHDRTHVAFESLGRDAERHTAEVVRIMREERDRATQRIREADMAIQNDSGDIIPDTNPDTNPEGRPMS